MKILTWNVNGIRAVAKKGFLEWLHFESPDVLCLQEVKANTEDLDEVLLKPFGYTSIFESAEKKGYSGVAVYAKKEPSKVTRGIGHPTLDKEGRVLGVEFGNTLIINSYFPNSQREHTRLPEKLEFCSKMLDFCKKEVSKGRDIIICGDFNIAHKPIDLKNPKTNENNAGFLPQERAWMDVFVAAGFVDVFRHFCKKPDQYTWWSYRPGVREKNIGWRLDYFFANQKFINSIKSCEIHPDVMGSDHCPVSLILN